jgi:hypothetical protein
LVDEKAQAAVLVADEDVDAVNAQVGGLTKRGRSCAHGRDYKAECMRTEPQNACTAQNGWAARGADCFRGERVRKWKREEL